MIKYFEDVKLIDRFDGFEVLVQVIDPHQGGGTCIVESDSIRKMYQHIGPWIKSFYCKVKRPPVLSDEDYLEEDKALLSQ